ncbi:MAG: ATP-binding cassette domain-containing protein, partial [Bacteroidales bacterium]
LPLGLNTKIGMEGNGLSTGQKQRIIIARAAYKDAKFLMFDGQHVSVDKLQGSEGHCRLYIC